ncbi:molecular chaperone DnaK [Micrococcales bacterium KH10]|nr:molecular chaperone DnaK [Micrococcales bacterium KH10]
MTSTIGIDLGTTYSAVSIIGSTGSPEILKNREGESTTPSVVLFQDVNGTDEPLVGTMAKHSAATAPEDIVQFIKRFMGNSHYKFESSSGTQYRPEEVSALIIRKLKEDAELALGHPVTDAVITVPAYFEDAQRKATIQAGTMAGLNVLRVLNEPTAAALAFGVRPDASGKVLVYDLGGGTFDITVMNIVDGSFDVIGTDGDRNLGGFDFDNALMNHIAAQIVSQGGPSLLDDVYATADLREKAEMAKRSLTNVEKTTVHVTAAGKPYRVLITRTEFEELTASLLRRTEDLIVDLLERHTTQWTDIDHILLVGGSTRMPMVRSMVERISGKSVTLGVDPDLAVAQGAAIQSAATEAEQSGRRYLIAGGQELSISDVTSHALGVITVTDDLVTERNTVVIPRESKIPAKCSVEVSTVSNQQRSMNVQVTQGDDPDPKYSPVVGSKTLPLTPYPQGAPFRLTYAYDIDQIVFIELFDLTANQQVGTFEVDRPAALSESALAAGTQKIQSVNLG